MIILVIFFDLKDLNNSEQFFEFFSSQYMEMTSTYLFLNSNHNEIMNRGRQVRFSGFLVTMVTGRLPEQFAFLVTAGNR